MQASADGISNRMPLKSLQINESVPPLPSSFISTESTALCKS